MALVLHAFPGILLLILLQLFAFVSGWFPITAYPDFPFREAPLRFSFSYLHHIAMPLLGAFLGGVGGTMRYIRATMLDQLGQPYVTALRSRGVSERRVTQIIPQMASILIVSVALGIPGFILGETALSFLGLGITDPAVSWGSMLNRNVTSLGNLRSFPWFLYPGVALLITTLSFSFLGDLLRDVLDPYHREPARG